MDKRVIKQTYEIVDTLFSNELQTIYVGKTVGSDEGGQFIINEFRDTDIIYGMKDSFSPDKCRYIRNIVETFYIDFNFYVVSTICAGPTLENFLSDNNLRLTEKMYLTESLLTQLTEMEKLSPFITFALCDASNLAVTGRRNICFNCNIRLSKEDMGVTNKDVSHRVGEIICGIFANTANTDPEAAKDVLPPALLPIVQRCLEGKYASIAGVYNDFKSLLLYSVFMGNVSVDSQMRRNFKKGRIRRKLSPVKRAAALIALLLIIWGGWTYMKNLNTLPENSPAPKNAKPAASFKISRDRVYAGDGVVFISDAYDPDAGDAIKSYFWVISKDGEPIFNSSNRNIAYKFETPGSYGVHLVVADSRDESSTPYKQYITVLPKPEPGIGIPAASDRK